MSRPKSAEAALAHNVFDSSARPRGEASALRRGDFSDPLSWPACVNVQAVLVTESSDPLWSLASLREPGYDRARLRRVGDRADGKRVTFIGFNPRQQAPAVWLNDDEAPCQAMLFRAPPPPPEVPVTGVATTTPDLSIVQRIQRVSDTTYNVERSLVESALGDTSQFLRSVRVVPEVKDGKTVGLRLFGIRPESLLSSLGVRNGDRLESINGFELAKPEKALEAYARLRGASQLRLRLTRASAPLELSVNVI